jgi:site-specific recombinase XerD
VSTVRAYTRAVAQFAEFFGKSPDDLSREHVRQFLLHLVREKKVSGSTYRQVLSAIRFLYRTTLGRDWVVEGIQHTKSEKKLPVVMSMDEVAPSCSAATSSGATVADTSGMPTTHVAIAIVRNAKDRSKHGGRKPVKPSCSRFRISM